MSNDLSPEALDVWRRFLTAHSHLTAAIERDLHAADVLPLSSYDVLLALHEAPDKCLRMHELAEAVVLSRSGLTRLVDRLYEVGLVDREPCPEDRRGQHAVLTAKGKAALRRTWPVYARSIEQHFAAHLSDTEVKRMDKLLSRVIEAS